MSLGAVSSRADGADAPAGECGPSGVRLAWGVGYPWLAQGTIALAAVALVGVAVATVLWSLAPAHPVPIPRSPFGPGAREAIPTATGFGRIILAWQAAFFASLRAAITVLKTDPSGLPLLLATGIAYGVFHAAGPGHGKAVIASYLVASERAVTRGIAVSIAAASVQAGVAIGLVAIVFEMIGGTAATMSRAAYAVEISGFALVSAIGAILVWRKAKYFLALAAPGAGPGARRPGDDPCACGPVDPRIAERGSLRQLALVAVGAGIRPCAGAILVLTFTRSQGLFAVGIATTLAMALGTAITTGALALVAVYAKRAALRLASGRSRGFALAAAGAELAAAAFVLVIGLALLAGVWDGTGGSVTGAAPARPGFEVRPSRPGP